MKTIIVIFFLLIAAWAFIFHELISTKDDFRAARIKAYENIYAASLK